MNPEFLDEVTRELSKKLTADGKLIEAGWVAFAKFVLPENVGAAQTRDMRAAFFAGAQHLLGSVTTIMDKETEEPTVDDLHRMDMIAAELDRFVDEELSRRIHIGPGHG